MKPNLAGIGMIGGISLVLLMAFSWRTFASSGDRASISLSSAALMFFLGAGFMLLETKSVVHMALLFGATWIVNSIVFAAILVMILLANLFVIAAKPRNLRVYYALLIAALVTSAFVPMDVFLSLPPPPPT